MNKQETQKKKEAYSKPEVHTYEPLRNITAGGPCTDRGGFGSPTCP